MSLLLWPLSVIFQILASLRRALYRSGILATERLPVPVIVVGNIAAGGSGKTPVVLWLVAQLRAQGYMPGIVSRGYGGRLPGPVAVSAESDVGDVGDEPVLLAQLAAVPVWIGRDRPAAARALLAQHPEVNVILTDDGLQHYRLARDVEIVVLDPAVLGNQFFLPAGPLRESLGRAAQASLVLAHGELSPALRQHLGRVSVFAMHLAADDFYRLGQPSEKLSASALALRRSRAIAAIGRPERFFESLAQLGIAPVRCDAFGDHFFFKADDLSLDGADVLLMTEKDAIKCAAIAPEETWVLPVRAAIDEGALACVLECMHGSEVVGNSRLPGV